MLLSSFPSLQVFSCGGGSCSVYSCPVPSLPVGQVLEVEALLSFDKVAATTAHTGANKFIVISSICTPDFQNRGRKNFSILFLSLPMQEGTRAAAAAW